MLAVNLEGLFIESWSGSAGYSAEMLTEDGKSWRVEDESTLASSVNIEAEYPALADHEELHNPILPRFIVNNH